MELKYVGPKPFISHSGIQFDNNKEDKFVYLNVVVQLIKAFDHEYDEDKRYYYDTDAKVLTGALLMHELQKFCPDINFLIEKKSTKAREYIEHEIKRTKKSILLNAEEKEALQNNIYLMKDYIIQRFVNKSIYYNAIEKLAELLKKEHIDYISIPMFLKFAHVLHSLQGSLKRQRPPIDTKMNIYKEGDIFVLRLQVA
jgi:hypothetical protein